MTVPDPSWAWRLGLHAQDLDANGHDTYAVVASSVTIADAGGYFTATDVEGALQELAKKDIGYAAHGNTGSTETFDALTGWHSATLNANCTFTFTGATSGLLAAMVLELALDGTHVPTHPGSVIWSGGVAPDFAIVGTTIVSYFSRDGGTTWYGFPAGGGTVVTTKGDLSGFSTVPARVPVGVDGQYLTADSTAALGVSYQTPAAVGPQHAHVNNVTFSGDGSTTAFELPAAPVDAYSIGVYVGTGRNNDWALSGALLTTLTFGSAPTAGTDNISVDIAAALA